MEIKKCPKCGATFGLKGIVATIRCPKCAHSAASDDFPAVEIRELYCPNPMCHAPLKIRTDAKQRVITCPKCHTTNSLSRFLTSKPEKENDDINATQGPTGKNNSEDDKRYKVGALFLEVDKDNKWKGDKVLPLKRGVNIIGRQSQYSDASLQLPTGDTFISKKHFVINVVMKANSTFEHQLSDNNSTNGTYHNNEQVCEGDIELLQPGDRIIIGHTVLKFDIL